MMPGSRSWSSVVNDPINTHNQRKKGWGHQVPIASVESTCHKLAFMRQCHYIGHLRLVSAAPLMT